MKCDGGRVHSASAPRKRRKKTEEKEEKPLTATWAEPGYRAPADDVRDPVEAEDNLTERDRVIDPVSIGDETGLSRKILFD